MPVLHQGLAGNHGYPSDRRLNRVPGKYDDDHDDESARMINFGRQKMGRTGWNKYENYGDPGGGGGGGGVGGGFGKGIEFRADNKGEESGTASPPLWKTSPSSSPPPPTDTTPLQSHPFNHHHYRLLSPDSRTQLILKGRQELMDMVKQMPETSYELSLKDLVELPKVGVERKTGFAEEREFSNGGMTQAENRRRKRSDKGKMGRSGSGSLNRNNNNNNGPFLLKMFFPISLGWKQKGSTNGTCAKVSPRPLVEGEKGEKDWWKKRFSVAGESGSSGRSGSSGGSSSGGSSGSRNRNRSRNMGAFQPACWPFIWTKKSNARDQKESIF